MAYNNLKLKYGYKLINIVFGMVENFVNNSEHKRIFNFKHVQAELIINMLKLEIKTVNIEFSQ